MNPVRLEKQEKKRVYEIMLAFLKMVWGAILTFLEVISEKVTAFLNQYAVLIILICIILLFILIGMLFATLFMDTNTTVPSMMDSGNYYYHLKDVI